MLEGVRRRLVVGQAHESCDSEVPKKQILLVSRTSDRAQNNLEGHIVRDWISEDLFKYEFDLQALHIFSKSTLA